MSTPTRRLLNLTEHSFVPRWAREQPEPADNELRPTDAVAHDPLASPYVPKHKPARSSLAADARGLTEPSLPLQGMHPSDDIGQQSVCPQDEIVDLERLETALRWLQCEAAAGRLRSPPSLESEGMPPPARVPRHALRWLLTVLLVTAAAPLVYYISADSPVSSSTSVAPRQGETIGRSFDTPRPIKQEVTGPIGFRDRYPGTLITPTLSPRQADIIRPEPTPAVETVALPAPRPRSVRALDREEIALLVRQGEQLIAAGDIAAARIVFQRASEAGDAAATVALAASYDPAVLKQIGAVGKHADLAKARSLYEKAERLGSAEATRRLQMLARQ